jgi:hypothetical protein
LRNRKRKFCLHRKISAEGENKEKWNDVEEEKNVKVEGYGEEKQEEA